MEQIILVIHLFLAIGLVVAVLMQKSEGGALGIGGSGGALVSVRGSAKFSYAGNGCYGSFFHSDKLNIGHSCWQS